MVGRWWLLCRVKSSRGEDGSVIFEDCGWGRMDEVPNYDPHREGLVSAGCGVRFVLASILKLHLLVWCICRNFEVAFVLLSENSYKERHVMASVSTPNEPNITSVPTTSLEYQ